MFIRAALFVCCCLSLLPSCAGAPQPEPSWLLLAAEPPAAWASVQAWDDEHEADGDDEGHGLLMGVALYLPNRIFDIFDMVRARLRLGPGIAVGVRATEVADVFVGSYLSVWVGIHGPRGEPAIPWPAGLESRTGLELSVADASLEGGIGPDYGMAEFGLGGQLAIVGFDLGIDPFEIADFVLGFLTIDLADDDY